MESRKFSRIFFICFSFLFLIVSFLYSAPGIDGGDEKIELHPSASYPKKGAINVPVLLINFVGEDTTYSNTDIEEVIYGDSSVKEFFEEVSYGDLIFNNTDVVDWTAAKYGRDYYDCVDAGDPDNKKAAELVREAVENADTALDYSSFDNNGDGYVDGVIVIHRGPGAEETGHDTDIWSHTWSLSAAGVDVYESNDTNDLGDTIIIDTYIIVPETLFNKGVPQIITIGVFCHEFGHLLGLPELYNHNFTLSYGIGYWDSMAYGFWNGDPPGSSPAHFSAWSKWFLDWVIPEQISDVGRPVAQRTIEPVEDIGTDTKVYQVLTNTGGMNWTPYGDGEGEYFLIENRQAVGFDAALPGAGLLIWHIDESKANNDDFYGYKLVDLEEADADEDLENTYEGNQGDGGDPYPGTADNTMFNLQTDPDNKLYDEESSKVRVENIELSGDDVLAYIFLNKDPILSDTSLNPDEGDTETYFDYYIDYQDDDDDTPILTYLIIDDGDYADTEYMRLQVGSAHDGTYRYTAFQLNAGEYTYYFSFDDGQGGVVRLPSSGSYSGPIVSGEEAEPPPSGDDTADTPEAEDNSLVQWHCFIATASYGTPMAQEVKVLSRFRDEYLVTSPAGKQFVNFYYKFSPAIADFVSKHPFLKKCVRGALTPVVKIAKILILN